MFTEQEYNEIQKDVNDILVKLETVEDQGWVKKGELIQRFVEKSRILLEAGKLPLSKKSQFSSYILHKLEERNVTVSRNERFSKLFSSDEKDPRGQHLDEMSKKISSGQTVEEEYRNNSQKEDIEIINDENTRLLKTGADCAVLVDRIYSALITEYSSNPESRKIIQEFLKHRKESYVTLYSTLKLMRDELDKREKYGDYEKIMFKFLLEVGDTKADLAQKVGYCSKYASIGIERNKDLDEYLQFARKCPECKRDIAHYINKQIQLYKTGEEIELINPIKGY